MYAEELMDRSKEGVAGISLRAPSFDDIKMRARSYTYEHFLTSCKELQDQSQWPP
jgi:hypothetical protein